MAEPDVHTHNQRHTIATESIRGQANIAHCLSFGKGRIIGISGSLSYQIHPRFLSGSNSLSRSHGIDAAVKI